MEESQLHIPEGWKSCELGSLYLEKRKSKFKVSDATNYGGIPFYTSGDAVLEHNEIQTDGENIFLATGGIANVKFYNGKVAYSTDTYVIVGKENISTQFLYFKILDQLYYINTNYFQGSGLKHLQKKDFKKHLFAFPKSKSEQTTIATILSKVDEAITQTEQLIAKYTRIKTGLMQDLLTKGIDENGNIRSEQTHEFKDSPLGRIPKEWECEKLSKYGFFTKGYSIAKSNLSDNGVSCVLYGEIYTKYNFYADTFYSKVPYEIVKDKTPLEYGDILFAGSGETHKDIGKCIAFIGSELTYAGGDIIIFRTHKFNPIFLSYFLNFFIVEKQKTALGQGSSVIHIYPDHLKQLMVVHFDIEEQNIIVEIIKNADKHISTLKTELTKLQSLKTGLMQDLLSGKVRVNDLKLKEANGKL